MTHVIAIVQTKGGTGKTTTTMMLASALTERGHRVLVLDSDKQGSANEWFEDAGEALGFEVRWVPTDRTLKTAISRYAGEESDYDFLLIDTPPGSNSMFRAASEPADLALVPTGVSSIDMKRTQATLDAFDGTDTPVAVVLVNVDKRESLLEIALEELTANTRAAVADVIIPTRAATRKAGSTAPKIATKPFSEWMELAEEIEQAF